MQPVSELGPRRGFTAPVLSPILSLAAGWQACVSAQRSQCAGSAAYPESCRVASAVVLGPSSQPRLVPWPSSSNTVLASDLTTLATGASASD
eukprot:2041736-Rhodomonas_salina.2